MEMPEEVSSGPEAREWLATNSNDSALASNRFGPTREAAAFVESLYAAGADNVIVPHASIRADDDTLEAEGGPYADSLGVFLPADSDRRSAVWELCRRELTSEGFAPDGGPVEDYVFLWWD